MSLTNDDKKWLTETILKSGERIMELISAEMGTRFSEVNNRLQRLDATLQFHGKQIAAGTKAISGFTEWTGKADGDYKRVLAEIANLKIRIEKLEPKQ